MFAWFGTKRPPVQIRPPRPRSQATPLSGMWPFLGAKLSPEPLERLERLVVGDLGVDVHRYVDLCMPQDSHGDPGMHVERVEKRGTGMPHVVHGDPADTCLGTACLEPAVQVPRLE